MVSMADVVLSLNLAGRRDVGRIRLAILVVEDLRTCLIRHRIARFLHRLR